MIVSVTQSIQQACHIVACVPMVIGRRMRKYFTSLQNTYSGKCRLLNVLFVILLGFLSLVVRGVLFIELYTVYKNFGKGLRERGNACLHVVDYCKTHSP